MSECDHKFIDSTSCVKCGWTPLQASEAWQDVQDRLGYIAVHHGVEKAEAEIWAAIERARAADAQQIAALRAENEQLRVEMAAWDRVGVANLASAEAQLTALQAEQAQWQQKACVWTENIDGQWESSCGTSWEFITDGPAENKTKFCHNCGGTVQPVKFIETIVDDE